MSGGRWRGGPDLGGAPGGRGLVPGGSAGAVERVECLLDAFGGEVAVQQVAELGAGQPVWGAGERGVDLFGERVAGGLADRPGRGAGCVVPERERRVEVLGADRGDAVEQRVDQRQSDRVCLGAGGELAGEPVGGLGELRVGVPPQLARGVGELDAAGALGVLERGGEVAGEPGVSERVRVAALGQQPDAVSPREAETDSAVRWRSRSRSRSGAARSG